MHMQHLFWSKRSLIFSTDFLNGKKNSKLFKFSKLIQLLCLQKKDSKENAAVKFWNILHTFTFRAVKNTFY